MKVNKITLYIVIVGIFLILVYGKVLNDTSVQYIPPHVGKTTLFSVQSIDTMKQSRDMAREKLHDSSFDTYIRDTMRLISDIGATHVAIGTPYDEEFYPILKRWVDAARVQGLGVWFRGNFSGWEGWFEYEKIDREKHKLLLASFLAQHGELFLSGDVFSPCPECENGGDGDPRATGDANGFRQFLIDEYTISNREFNAQDKIITVYTSMNGDIAREIINPLTARALGGTILIDHYVKSPIQFGHDVSSISKNLQASVGIGEFGGPIPDIHGSKSRIDQAELVDSFLNELYVRNELVPIVNYWVLEGGSTSLIDNIKTTRPAFESVKKYFTANRIYGTIFDSLGEPLTSARIEVASTTYSSDAYNGSYNIFLVEPYNTIIAHKEGFKSILVKLDIKNATSTLRDFYLTPSNPSLWYKIKKHFKGRN